MHLNAQILSGIYHLYKKRKLLTWQIAEQTASFSSAGGLGYGEGDRVRHLKYGEGTVVKIEEGPRDYQVTVVFDEVGQKIMYAGFAKLKKA